MGFVWVFSKVRDKLANMLDRTTDNYTSVSLSDKFDLAQNRILLTGAQAVVRLSLMQHERDRLAGLNTAGYVTGYRGSPIAGLEGQFARADDLTAKANILFHSAVNEDLAATALWGTQQAELRGEGKYDGVFGIWYGKGPGVDRSGDVFRHANHAGTSKFGGVLALMGDDHTCESSTSAHQSEFAFVDAMIPVLNPANVQEIIDFGLLGLAMSRYSGAWVGLKCVKDNMESTGNVDGRLDRVEINTPDDFEMPDGGINIRLGDTALDKEARLHDHKRDAILAFARANRLDRHIWNNQDGAKIGIVSAGKSYLDVLEALENLGLDEGRAEELGISLYKVGLVWPLEPQHLAEFVDGLELVIVVEEKRSLIETQIKEQLYGQKGAPVVIGKKDEHDQLLFPAKGALDPLDISIEIGQRILSLTDDGEIKKQLALLNPLRANLLTGAEIATRVPYFCAGCPHNSSTTIPKGDRAYAGIGCHYMVQWMDRDTDGFTQMGGEGANWIGEAPFSTRKHVFQNIGDGTYIHSGILAIRAAVAAGTNVTFKLLYNDAVAMTGGQALDGGLTVRDMARQLKAEGVERLSIVSDNPDQFRREGGFPDGTKIYHRDRLEHVQKELSEIPGVTALIYEQTCAAEKRRRRKRGTYPDPAKRVYINSAVCEGCGDCGVQSNCVAIVPKETEFGRKRAIDQSACNKDYSCLNGFCPSFVTVHGGRLKSNAGLGLGKKVLGVIAEIPEPDEVPLNKPYSLIVDGIGGTGVVTISAVLGQAAHIEGLGFGSIDMAGLAQKGGAVSCHMRFGAGPSDIHTIRVGVAGADVIIGGDLIVTGSHKVLESVRPDHTRLVVNAHPVMTGDFTHAPNLQLPELALKRAIEKAAGSARVDFIDAHLVTEKLLGSNIYANMFLMGFAYQLGLVPLNVQSIEAAIRLNGVAVENNSQAFQFGRLAAYDKTSLDRLISPITDKDEADGEFYGGASGGKLDEIIERNGAFLTRYQDEALAGKYRDKMAWFAGAVGDDGQGLTELVVEVAKSYFKLLSYKDEYEVARLFSDGAFEREIAEHFEGDYRIEYHLAPPILSRAHPDTGLPLKRSFGAWMGRVFGWLAKYKKLRGTRYDIFGGFAERKLERQLIVEFERVIERIAREVSAENVDRMLELARLPQSVRGFGHVKLAAVERARARERELLKLLNEKK